jgi:GT2 family glycosyltransferase
MTVRSSVIVPTYKRPHMLARCLDALLAQDFDPSAYEIIVADDAACAETRRQVECLAARARPFGPAIRYVAVTARHGPAAARNVGWHAARAPILAFTDDDCIPERGWLKAGVAALGEGVAGAAGKLVVPCPAVPTDYERNAALLANAEFVTANCFYRRDAIADVGGFDERFRVAWREDSDLVFRLIGRDARLVRAPHAVVVHPVRPAPWGVSIRQQRRSIYNALLYKKHPALYRERIQSAPPWRYYGICGTLLLALVSLMLGKRRRTLLATALWLVLTGRFCLCRLDGTSRAPGHVAEMAVTSAVIPPLTIFWRLRGALRYRVPFL